MTKNKADTARSRTSVDDATMTTTDHPRDSAGLRYVYSVVSRRAAGVSIGVNLNPNAACNWRCIYCQVPGLSRGSGPSLDLALLESELNGMLESIVHGSFLQDRAPENARILKDVAFSGDGEPTTCPDFGSAVSVVGQVLERLEVLGKIDVTLITNGSQLHKPSVQSGISQLARLGGTVWFKVDGGNRIDFAARNSVTLDPQRHLERLRLCASLCPTFVQTCVFARRGDPPSESSVRDYLGAIKQVAGEPGIKGVLLYNIARRSHQPEANELAPLPEPWLEELASRIRALGLVARVSA